jgi:polysaccharide pyruvyl transferase WcaK-like protein
VIRTHHSPVWTIDRYFLSPNTLISDLPSDYLSIYAQAAEVHSDRVHACIAALSFGNRARFYVQNEPRLRMFARLGIENVAHELTDLDPEVLRREKQDQVRFLRDSLLPDEA